jgi:hypothetical protein
VNNIPASRGRMTTAMDRASNAATRIARTGKAIGRVLLTCRNLTS